MADEETKTITIKVSEHFAKKLRVLGAEDDRAVSELVREAIVCWWDVKGYKESRGELIETHAPVAQ